MAKTKNTISIGIFGYGNMGRAIASRLLGARIAGKRVTLSVYSLGVHSVRGATCVGSLSELLNRSTIVFVCIKPQEFYTLPADDKQRVAGKTIVSIMAGVRVRNIKKIFPGAKVVRVMPNLALQVGQGVIGWYAGAKELSNAQRTQFNKIFEQFGLSMPVRSEAKLDAITAISGSGPAYVFLFANALLSAARDLGFSRSEAEQLVLQTISGSLSYAQSATYNFGELIQMVQSKGGTTEAALNSLNTKEFEQQWRRAIRQAYIRAQEISAYEQK